MVLSVALSSNNTWMSCRRKMLKRNDGKRKLHYSLFQNPPFEFFYPTLVPPWDLLQGTLISLGSAQGLVRNLKPGTVHETGVGRSGSKWAPFRDRNGGSVVVCEAREQKNAAIKDMESPGRFRKSGVMCITLAAFQTDTDPCFLGSSEPTELAQVPT